MRYHYELPEVYTLICGQTYICDHPAYNRCTLYTIKKLGLAVIQQRIDGETKATTWTEIDPWLVDEIYTIGRRDRGRIETGLDDDFSFSVSHLGRFRVNVFRQRGSLAAVIRVIRFGLPDPAKLGIPESVLSLAENKKGLVLITGAAGTGKSTTLACMIDRINRSRECHIITMAIKATMYRKRASS